MIFVPTLPFLDCAFDITTFTFISALIVLSVFSCCFIFHLHLKSKHLPHLQDFNSLWTVRLLFVLFVFLWAVTELFRSPFFRRTYLYSFLPSLGVTHQDNLCKAHIILSLGFFEPAFLVILLFLLNASIRERTPNDIWAISFVAITCLPVATVQGFFILIERLQDQLPGFFRLTSTSIVVSSGSGDETVLCAFPLLNSIAFGAFGIAYAIAFMFSCWKVLSLVINKGLRRRIYQLSFTVLIALLLQIVSLMLTNLWDPDKMAYGVASLVAFLGAFACATAGQGIMVIKPISDALDAGGTCCRWSQNTCLSRNSEMMETGTESKGPMNV